MLKICRGDLVETLTTFLTLSSKSSQGTSVVLWESMAVQLLFPSVVCLGFLFWVCLGPRVQDNVDLLGL